MSAKRRNEMTPKSVLARVAKIAKMAGDDESAHSAEDDLHKDVLSAIASGKCVDPKECARIAMTTTGIPFSRWYA